jgi:hypothetical protein
MGAEKMCVKASFGGTKRLLARMAVGAGIIFFIAAACCAMEDVELKGLFSESLQIHNQFDQVMSEMNAATSDLDERLRQVSARIKWFKQPALDDERIYDVNKNITFYRNQIAQLEAFIEAAKITDPMERGRLVDKYEADNQRLLAEEWEAAKPFRKRLDELEREVEDKQAPFKEAMKAYCLLPKGKYPALAGTSVSTPFHTGKLTYEWLDSNGKQLAWAWVGLKDKPVIEDDAKMLDDKFYVSEHYRISIHVWAGHFEVIFNITKPEWQGEERIAELIKDFIDLDGLAKIDPTQSDSSLNALAMGSLSCSKKYRSIIRERSEVTGPLTDETLNAEKLKARFSKPPADSEQLKEDRRLLEYYKKRIKQEQPRLEVSGVTDPDERTARVVKLEAEQKSLRAEKDKIAKPYYDKTRELKSGLEDKEAALDEAMKRYFLMGGKAYPGAESISTRTLFYDGSVNCNWKDADGKYLCNATLRVRNRPVIPGDAQMLDGIYYISDIATNDIQVWVGNFQVGFQVDADKREWHGEEKIGDILKHFVDLTGLAKIG